MVNLTRNIQIKKENVYISISTAALIFTISVCLISHGSILVGGNDTFMDFFNHITYVTNSKEVYFTTMHACFPPFSYIFYKFLNEILPYSSTSFQNSSGTTGLAYLIYAIYLVVIFSILTVIIQLFLEEKYGKGKTLWITILLFLSYSYTAGAIERGNSALMVLLLLLLSIKMRNSDNPVFRELSLILIAFAAGFKVYPAVFGFQYIKEKRFKEACRLFLYGCIVMFAPFSLFGGVEGLKRFVSNQLVVQTIEKSKLSMFGILSNFIMNERFLTLAWLVIAIILLVIYCIASSPYQDYFALSAMMIFIPKWSGTYTLIYMTIPFLLFLEDLDNHNNFLGLLQIIVLSVGMCNLCAFNYWGISAVHIHIFADYLALILASIIIVYDYINQYRNRVSAVKHKI